MSHRMDTGQTMFKPCEICGEADWQPVYRGQVRDGVLGSFRDNAVIGQCKGCGIHRLIESFCLPDTYYETGEYREHLKQSLESWDHFSIHDKWQIFALQSIWPDSLRGKVVADVGCAGGSFLDHAKGMAKRLIAIEPCTVYHERLRLQDYTVYPYCRDAVSLENGQVDLAVSFYVIEHTSNPVMFLKEIRPLISDNGYLVISTPNRNDILMKLLPDCFASFFYRAAHRWYFDIDSLSVCAAKAGFEIHKRCFIHRYGMSNALYWLRDKQPLGLNRIDGISDTADKLWKSYLEATGQSESIFAVLRPLSRAIFMKSPSLIGCND